MNFKFPALSCIGKFKRNSNMLFSATLVSSAPILETKYPTINSRKKQMKRNTNIQVTVANTRFKNFILTLNYIVIPY